MQPYEKDLFEAAAEALEERDRALVDQLIADTRLYDSARALKELLDFTARLLHLAPFNAMLLHIQKPGLSFAARQQDWWKRFRRQPKRNARPLVILRNFGPVDFVYDLLDTEGEPVPEAVYSFPTSGDVPEGWLAGVERQLGRVAIELEWLDCGDQAAGYARPFTTHGDGKRLERFEIGVNRNHLPASQLVTIAHELAHIYLGHCGGDEKRGVKLNRPADEALREVEAETVAYLVAKRTGLLPRSESYLDGYQGAFDHLDLHRILKVASKVEKHLGLPFPAYRIFA
ncbi:ImmA/IrrE family metallo-endopeptidase [Lamprobacter modestohalophilus]|uniref:ImmA/IrrE family metallo-endopeptidase n=1 Tax=Lamprobacter modestohalophilus TaxID=1064514 RepID=UPI002ADECC12|nr:ImmA/IrrE family metallo-endopeptidase [Lamprobacter modestohalophilus]MEA1052712.1 ImmA/IrrE family metallo-endopeptidase [Lamprobacter modestohalophilus]